MIDLEYLQADITIKLNVDEEYTDGDKINKS